MEVVLLLVAVVCVIALIYIAKKRKALDESIDIKVSSSTGTSGSGNGAEGGSSGKPEEEKASGPRQITVYEFSAKTMKRCCPFCDGENSTGANACSICGRDL